MEVHAHTHLASGETHTPNPDNHRSRKKWTYYLWEFLMLFLAVFCGFLAENQREHMVEHKREKQFIQSFIEDLKSDTAAIRSILDFRKNKIEKMDSLMLLLSSQKIKGFENELYYFGRIVVRSLTFRSNDRTITQLKNSGSLRLIRNEQVADSMMVYQKLVETIMTNQGEESNERFNTYPIISRMFNAFVFDKMVTINGISRPDNNPPLRSYDPNIQQDLAFYVHQLKGSTYIIIQRLNLLNGIAKNTIEFLKKEYHLK